MLEQHLCSQDLNNIYVSLTFEQNLSFGNRNKVQYVLSTLEQQLCFLGWSSIYSIISKHWNIICSIYMYILENSTCFIVIHGLKEHLYCLL